jgi:CrcB protein
MHPLLSNMVWVALGGGLGSVLRLLVFHLAEGPGRHHGPWSTTGINVVGSLALGLVLGHIEARGQMDERLRLFLTVGVLGGFTTFSTFSGDALRLLHDRRPFLAMLYVGVSVGLGLACCAAGYALGLRLAR